MTAQLQSHPSDDLSQRDLYLSELSDSDEDVEDLLAGGADVSDLIAAGVLEDEAQLEGLESTEEFVARTQSEWGKSPEEQIPFTEEEEKAALEKYDRMLNRDYSNASSQPH